MPRLVKSAPYTIKVIKKLVFINNNYFSSIVRIVLLIAGLGIIGLALGLAAIYGIPTEELPSGERVAYATFYPYYEFTTGVVGDVASTAQLAPNGVQIHGWGPSPSSIHELQGAYALVFSNSHAEPYVSKLENSGEFSNVAFIEASPHIEEHDDHDDDISHYWLDPVNAIEQVKAIRDGLSSADPQNATAYERNASAYIERLQELDTKYSTGLAECQYRTIITFHNAYKHMAERYDLEVFGTATAHHAESSASDIAEMIEYSKETGVGAVFADELADARQEQVIADELGVDVIPLSTLEALGDGEYSSYFAKMEQNLAALKEGLGCR